MQFGFGFRPKEDRGAHDIRLSQEEFSQDYDSTLILPHCGTEAVAAIDKKIPHDWTQALAGFSWTLGHSNFSVRVF